MLARAAWPLQAQQVGGFVNLPNSMTLSRIACVPLLIWLLSASSPLHGHTQEWAISLFFIAASVTDGLDGYLARKRGQITTMGMLLDPLADKLLVTSAYIALVAFDPAVVKPWIAVVVIGREFLVSGLRSIAANEGFTIDASEIGKLKTVLQIVSVVACVFDRGYRVWVFGPGSNLLGGNGFGWFVLPVHVIAVTAVCWMTIVSIISAVDYFAAFWNKVNRASEARRVDRSLLLSRKKTA